MKIAILQTAFLGDLVLTAPLVDYLYRLYGKDLELYYILSKGKDGLFKEDSRIKEVIVYDKRGTDRGFKGMRRLSKKLSKLNLDVFINLHRYSRSHLLTLFTKAKKKYGFFDLLFWPIYTKTIKRDMDKHEVLRNIDFLSFFDQIAYDFEKGSNDTKHSLFVNEDRKNLLKDIFASYIVIAPGTEGPTKAWPAHYYARLTKLILDKTDFKILVLGSNKDEARCKIVVDDDLDHSTSFDSQNVSFLNPKNLNKKNLANIKEIYSKHRIFNFCGKTSVRELVDIISGSSLTITNDSGPLHIASLTDTMVVGFFGPTVERFGFFPYTDKGMVLEELALKCRPCSMHGAKPCKIKTFDCMKNIKPDYAFAKILEFLKNT